MSPPPSPLAAPPGAIYHAAPIDAAALRRAASRAAALGFDALCLAAPVEGMAEAAREHGLRLLLDAPMAA
ncbi:hypothetical protein, partial [Pseudoroseomonas ludipueritiae]